MKSEEHCERQAFEPSLPQAMRWKQQYTQKHKAKKAIAPNLSAVPIAESCLSWLISSPQPEIMNMAGMTANMAMV
jgi:hypothetical protein